MIILDDAIGKGFSVKTIEWRGEEICNGKKGEGWERLRNRVVIVVIIEENIFSQSDISMRQKVLNKSFVVV